MVSAKDVDTTWPGSRIGPREMTEARTTEKVTIVWHFSQGVRAAPSVMLLGVWQQFHCSETFFQEMLPCPARRHLRKTFFEIGFC